MKLLVDCFRRKEIRLLVCGFIAYKKIGHRMLGRPFTAKKQNQNIKRTGGYLTPTDIFFQIIFFITVIKKSSLTEIPRYLPVYEYVNSVDSHFVTLNLSPSWFYHRQLDSALDKKNLNLDPLAHFLTLSTIFIVKSV